MSVVIERAEANNAGMLFMVRRDADSIVITWPCGQRRRFTLAAIARTLEHLDKLADYPDVWACRS